MTDSYLADVPGVKDVRFRGGTLLPRRSVIEIDGARVYDDAVNGQTVIDLRPPFVERQINFADFPGAVASTFQCPNDDSDLYRFVGVTDLFSLGAPIVGGRRKVTLLNMHAAALDIVHEEATVTALTRFATGDGLTLTLAANGGFCTVAYIASRWRVVG